MSLGDAMRQKSEQLEFPLEYRGEAPNGRRNVEALTVVHGDERSSDEHLMEMVVEEGNMQAAMKRVRQNKGSPGFDGMSVEELSKTFVSLAEFLLLSKPALILLNGCAPSVTISNRANTRHS